MHTLIRTSLAATIGTACLLAVLGLLGAPAPAAAIDPVEPGRFVWFDLMSKDVNAAKRFYGALFGWRFEDTKRGDRPTRWHGLARNLLPASSMSVHSRTQARSGSVS
jgi:hypothetical protein